MLTLKKHDQTDYVDEMGQYQDPTTSLTIRIFCPRSFKIKVRREEDN